MSWLRSLLPVREGETSRVALLFAYFFFVVAFTIAGKSARDSFFLSRYDRSLLPLMFIAVAILVALTAALYTKLARRLPRQVLLALFPAGFALSLWWLASSLEGWRVPVFYIWTEVIITTLTLQFWLLASDILDARQAKRLFGLIAAGGSTAAIVVGTSLKPFVKTFGAEGLLLLLIAFLAMVLLLAQINAVRARLARPTPPPPTPAKPTERKLDLYLLGITTAIAMSAVVTTLIDYQFKIIAGRSFPDESALVGFFGQFYAATGLSTLLVQIFLTAPLLARYGILAGLLALPTMLALGSTALLAAPVLLSAVLSKFSDQSLKFTINNSSLELLWLPVPPHKRQSTKPFVSGTMKAAAEGVAGAVTFALTRLLPLQFLSVVSLAAVAVWVSAAFRLRGAYLKALIRAVERGKLDLRGLELDAQDSAMVAALDTALRDGGLIQQLFVLDLIEHLPLAPWRDQLRRLLLTGPVELRRRIIAVAAEDPSILDDDTLRQCLRDGGPIAIEAAKAARLRQATHLEPDLRHWLATGSPAPAFSELPAAAAAALETLRPADPAARQLLHRLLHSTDPREQIAALRQAGDLTPIVTTARLLSALQSPLAPVREAALEVVRRRQPVEPSLLPAVIASAAHRPTALAARAALAAFQPSSVLAEINHALAAAEPATHVLLLRTLRDFPNEESAAAALAGHLSASELAVRQEAADSLLAIARIQPLSPTVANATQSAAAALLRQAYQRIGLLQALSPQSDTLLRDHLIENAPRRAALLVQLCLLRTPSASVESCVAAVRAADTPRLPLVVELLDNLLDRDLREALIPLVEKRPPAVFAQIAAERFAIAPIPPDSPELRAQLESWLLHGSQWEAALALDALRRRGFYTETARPSQLRPNPLLDDAFQQRKPGSMYSILQKTILLKAVDLFRDIPAEELWRVAQVATEVNVEAGATLFREGDPADSLYVLAAGAMQLQKNGQSLGPVRQGSAIGEMGLLDGLPRLAAVVAVEDSTLLRIDQQGFEDVLASSPQITTAILRLVSGRMRTAVEKLAGS